MKSDLFNFNNLGIAPKILDILQEWGFNEPTLIQSKSIPIAIEGKDLVGIAQTGTGKTLAFGIPMIQRLNQTGGRGLLLLPTRELASQANAHLRNIGAKFGLQIAVLIGGEPKRFQLRALKLKPQIIIATPGRLIDHIKNNTIDLKKKSIEKGIAITTPIRTKTKISREFEKTEANSLSWNFCFT